MYNERKNFADAIINMFKEVKKAGAMAYMNSNKWNGKVNGNEIQRTNLLTFFREDLGIIGTEIDMVYVPCFWSTYGYEFSAWGYDTSRHALLLLSDYCTSCADQSRYNLFGGISVEIVGPKFHWHNGDYLEFLTNDVNTRRELDRLVRVAGSASNNIVNLHNEIISILENRAGDLGLSASSLRDMKNYYYNLTY